ncbi:MAG: hypothetical protein JSW16_01770 [Dehalococcoidales bacterium]|nr:MAG: hypothetical protein JSW16_01770 [Dehalococcoidales bacterium]
MRLFNRQWKIKPVLLAGLLIPCLLFSSCRTDRDFDDALKSIVQPYLFSFHRWELGALLDELGQIIGKENRLPENPLDVVGEYFSSVDRIKTLRTEIALADAANDKGKLSSLQTELDNLQTRATALEGMIERILEQQIRDTLTRLDIFHPADRYLKFRVSFPPVNFKLENPPLVLVISPRDRIESIREITLLPDIPLTERKDIEAKTDELGVSSLVVTIGGLGATYPTLVTNEASLRFIIDTATEEWLHQYLAFKPLGFSYLLDLTGISPNYEIATMNETLAGMVSEEVGSIIYQTYYNEQGNGNDDDAETEPEFDFNHEMREIRKTVDALLTGGEIEQAEKFMEEKRQYLASMGYYIRKLNQAYFAFHGTYADEPTSVSPIGAEMRQLRKQVSSLKEFLNLAASMTSREDLKLHLE